MMFDEICRQKNARRVGQTHNNKNPAFRAYSFTSTGMTFLTVTFTNVSFFPKYCSQSNRGSYLVLKISFMAGPRVELSVGSLNAG